MANRKESPPEVDELPSAQDFCVSVPLYKSFRFDNEKSNPFFSLEHFKGSLDIYCPECGRHSVFTLGQEAKYSDRSHYSNYVFSLWFRCSRDASHHALFVFLAHKGVLQKIGETPSLADISVPDVRKYRPVLGDERFREFTRGIGLATHGVGVGAFVYLRRIFEWLIENAHTAASATPGWSEESYVNSRMEEKINLLKDHLPEFLVRNRGLYGILSVGIHALTEGECLSAFPAVRLAIELILDDLLEEHERQAKVKAAGKSLEALKTSIGKPGT
jgi:hypothetical protein